MEEPLKVPDTEEPYSGADVFLQCSCWFKFYKGGPNNSLFIKRKTFLPQWFLGLRRVQTI